MARKGGGRARARDRRKEKFNGEIKASQKFNCPKTVLHPVTKHYRFDSLLHINLSAGSRTGRNY